MTERAKGVCRLRPSDWRKPGTDNWRGRFDGAVFGTGASVIFYASEEVGAGPPLHVHPYDEIFIVREGRALFRIGDEEMVAEAGDILFGPANVPHRFVNLGPGRLETTDLHVTDTIVQTDLD